MCLHWTKIKPINTTTSSNCRIFGITFQVKLKAFPNRFSISRGFMHEAFNHLKEKKMFMCLSVTAFSRNYKIIIMDKHFKILNHLKNAQQPLLPKSQTLSF